MDFLKEDVYDLFRLEQLRKTGLPGETLLTLPQLKTLNLPCVYGHDPSVCLCSSLAEGCGQDESVAKQNHKLANVWTVNNMTYIIYYQYINNII